MYLHYPEKRKYMITCQILFPDVMYYKGMLILMHIDAFKPCILIVLTLQTSVHVIDYFESRVCYLVNAHFDCGITIFVSLIEIVDKGMLILLHFDVLRYVSTKTNI